MDAITTKLATFGRCILDESRRDGGSDVDGGTIQDYAEACGLLVRIEVKEPCGEICYCAEYGDFPQECLRYVEGLKP